MKTDLTTVWKKELEYILREYGTSSTLVSFTIPKQDSSLYRHGDIVQTKDNKTFVADCGNGRITMLTLNRVGRIVLWLQRKTSKY